MEELLQILNLPVSALLAWLYWKERIDRREAQKQIIDLLTAQNLKELDMREKEVRAKNELTAALNKQAPKRRNPN